MKPLKAILLVSVGLICLWMGVDGMVSGAATSASRFVHDPITSSTQPLRYWFNQLFWFGLGIYLVLWPIISVVRKR